MEKDGEISRRVLVMNNHLSNSVDHLDQLQTKMRKLALTWLLGTFAGIGFVFSSEDVYLPFSHLIGVIAVCLAGLAGIITIFIQDILHYQKLIDTIFNEGIKLEKQHPWLPQLRQRIMQAHENKSFVHTLYWFYYGSGALLLAISGIALTWWTYNLDPYLAFLPAVSAIVAILLYRKLILRLTIATSFCFDPVEIPESAIAEVDKDSFQKGWTEYKNLSLCYESYHYSSNMIKQFSSTWLLAAFFAIGYVLSAKEANIPFHFLVGILLICLAGVAGITLMWNLDVLGYQKLIHTVFFEGLELEKKYLWLPRERHNMLRAYPKEQAGSHIALFYIFCNTLLLLIGLLALGKWLFILQDSYAYLGMGIYLLLSIGFIVFMSKKSSTAFGQDGIR